MFDQHHMYLYGQDLRIKLESREGLYQPLFNGDLLNMSDGIERLLVYYTYIYPSASDFSELLQLNIPGITPVEIQKFKDMFKMLHSPEPVEKISLKDVPYYGDKENGICIPAADFVCTISQCDEQYLLSLLSQDPPAGHTVLSLIEDWFKGYCRDYNLHYKSGGEGTEHIDLAENFLKIHGVSPNVCKKIEHIYTEAEKQAIKKAQREGTVKGYGLLLLSVVAWLGISCGLLLAGDKLMDRDGWFVFGCILLLLGFAVLGGVPAYFIDQNKKRNNRI